MAGLMDFLFNPGMPNPTAYYGGMDPIFMLVLFIIGGCIVGILFGLIFKPEKYETLSVKEALKASFGTAFMGLIIGAVAALLLSLFPLFKFGLSGLSGSFWFFIIFIIGGWAVFFVIGFIYWYVPLPTALKHAVIFGTIGVVFGLACWMVFVSNTGPAGSYMAFAFAPIREQVDKFFTSLDKFRYCFYADAKCPFFIQWDEPTTQSPQEVLNIDLQFSDNKILQNRVDVQVSMTLKNPEKTEIKITPKCYLGDRPHSKDHDLEVMNLGKYALGDEFAFPLSSAEMHTTFRCVGDLPDNTANAYIGYVIVNLERPVNLKGNWPIYIGSEPNMGRTKSVMSFNAPYSFALVSDSDMPFEEGKNYDFSLVIKRLDEDANLTSIQDIKLKFPESMIAECQDFQVSGQTLEVENVDPGVLKNTTQYDKKEDIYRIPCSLYIREAPVQAVLAPIEIEANYKVISEYETTVLKEHS